MRSKKYQKIREKVDKNKVYSIDEAIEFFKENSLSKFNQTIELHVRLGIDIHKTEQQVRGTVVLPSGVIKKKKIAVFVTGDKEKEAKEAGADLVGGDDLIEKIKESGKCDFEVAIAEPGIMKNLSQIAKILGPKGLMPNPKSDTVTTDIKKAISELQKGKVTFKNDAGGNLHQAIGKISWPKEKIRENAEAFINAVKKSRPAGVKGKFIKGIFLSSTMGPSLMIDF